MVTVANAQAPPRADGESPARIELRAARGDSSFGAIYTAESRLGVVLASLDPFRPEELWAQGFKLVDGAQRFGSCLRLARYIDEREDIDCPLHLIGKHKFFIDCWQALLRIPPGSTVGYGQLAAMAGYPMRARAAGAAMAHNPLPFFLPCHRVIKADGSLGGYGGREDIKRELLRREGVYIK